MSVHERYERRPPPDEPEEVPGRISPVTVIALGIAFTAILAWLIVSLAIRERDLSRLNDALMEAAALHLEEDRLENLKAETEAAINEERFVWLEQLYNAALGNEVYLEGQVDQLETRIADLLDDGDRQRVRHQSELVRRAAEIRSCRKFRQDDIAVASGLNPVRQWPNGTPRMFRNEIDRRNRLRKICENL